MRNRCLAIIAVASLASLVAAGQNCTLPDQRSSSWPPSAIKPSQLACHIEGGIEQHRAR